jgi:hypothetical protein
MRSTIAPLIKAQGKKLSERQFALRLGIGYSLNDAQKQKLNIYQLNENRKGYTFVMGIANVYRTPRKVRAKLLQYMIVQDIRAGRSACFVDPGYNWEIWEAMVQEAYKTGRENELIYLSVSNPEFGVRLIL